MQLTVTLQQTTIVDHVRIHIGKQGHGGGLICKHQGVLEKLLLQTEEIVVQTDCEKLK